MVIGCGGAVERLATRLRRLRLSSLLAVLRLASGFIANYVEVRDSILYVSGGFPEWWTVTSLPSTSVLGIGLVVEFEPEDLNIVHSVTAAVRRVDGAALVVAGDSIRRKEAADRPADSPIHMCLASTVLVEFSEEGRHEVEVRWTDRDQLLDIIRFDVVMQ